jgi:isochorismate synthase
MISFKKNTLTKTQLFLEEIKKIINKINFTNSSFACWRLPNHNSIEFCASEQNFILENDLESMEPGFILSPFIEIDKNKVLYIPLEIYGDSEKGFLKYKELKPNPIFKKKTDLSLNNSNNNSSISEYTSLVKLAVESLSNQPSFMKVVTARKKIIKISEKINIFDTFLKVDQQLPSHFVSLHYTPQYGLWLGASPEILIEIKGKIFKTVALAGSQPGDQSISCEEAKWTQKEIEEQALVSRYIIDCFKKIRLREYIDFGPQTIVADNIMHLITEFIVNMDETNFPQLGTVMLRLLHPTSAVCGMPKEQALKFITTYEKMDRKLYTGYLGPVNINQKTNLFVNLRCAEILNNNAILYAGAGITKASNPEKEFYETELKMNTIAKFLE